MNTIEDKVREIVNARVVGHRIIEHTTIDSRLDALEERIAMLEARPILHERDEDGHWICCCGDHLEESAPAEPRAAGDLLTMVREAAIDPMFRALPQLALSLDELRERLDAMEKQVQHLMEEPDPNWERLLDRVEKLEAKPIPHECGTVDGNWVCCCGDHLEKSAPAEPEPMGLLESVAWAIATAQVDHKAPERGAILAVADWLEGRGYFEVAATLQRHLEP